MENYIKVSAFPSNFTKEQVLDSNGHNLTNYCTYAITEESNSNYVIDLEFTLEANEWLVEENILKVKLDYGYEIFRISKVKKSLRYIDVTARQIVIADTLNYWLDDVRPTDTTGINAIQYLNTNATSRNKEIMFSSDIDTTNTAYYMEMSLYKALFDSDNSFINRWGGEPLFRGYKLSINKRIGNDSNVTIREAKNLTGFNGESNIDNLVTRAVGKGYNGIKGDYIESPLINNYLNIYTKVIEYPDVRLKSDESTTEEEGVLYFDTLDQAKKELNSRIEKEFKDNDIDKLKATYTVNFVQLEDSIEYKNYSHAEKVNIGDVVRVYVPKVDTDIKVRVINKKYDVLAQRTKEIELSNEVIIKAIQMSDIINDLQQIENTSKNPVGAYINAMQQAGLQNSYVICRENEFLAMDTKDINTAKNVVKINNNGLFFSQNGYYGDYEMGFTIDGVINANLIRTGILTAIMIQNADASMRIDLSNRGGATFYSNSLKAMEMSGTQLKFYNWEKDGDYTGSIGSLVQTNNRAAGVGLWHDYNDSCLRLAYKDGKGVINDYLVCDNYNVVNNVNTPIKVGQDMGLMYSSDLYFYRGSNNSLCAKQYATTTNALAIGGGNGVVLGVLNSDGSSMSNIVSVEDGKVFITGTLYINGEKVYPGTGGGSGSGGTVLTGSWWDIAFEMVGREESGHSDPGMISNISWDAGGKSYGAYQFSLNMGSLSEFVDWLPTEGSSKALSWYNRLSAHALGSDAFDSEWVAIANEDHDGFLHIQQKRMIVAFYKPALNQIKNINPNIDLGNYTVGLNACVLSTAIQFGPGGYNSNGSVWSYVFGSGAMDEPSMLLRFKESRTAYFSATSERYAREYTSTMEMYNTYNPKKFGDGYGSPNGGSALQQSVVTSARKLIGKPYRYGGNYPPLGNDDGTDCSGLCQWAYNDNGISISRTTYTQINEGIEVVESQLQPGDLVFPRGKTDNGHVFMYSGESNGQHMCVEAPYTGVNITERAFTWDDSTYRARRILT